MMPEETFYREQNEEMQRMFLKDSIKIKEPLDRHICREFKERIKNREYEGELNAR